NVQQLYAAAGVLHAPGGVEECSFHLRRLVDDHQELASVAVLENASLLRHALRRQRPVARRYTRGPSPPPNPPNCRSALLPPAEAPSVGRPTPEQARGRGCPSPGAQAHPPTPPRGPATARPLPPLPGHCPATGRGVGGDAVTAAAVSPMPWDARSRRCP